MFVYFRREAKRLIDIQLPWVFEIVNKLPNINILSTKVQPVSSDIYKVEVWVQNENYLPFPTAMGSRNSRPAPAVLVLEGKDIQFLEGKGRTPITKVGGLETVKISFLIQAKKGTTVSLKLESKFAGSDQEQIVLSN